MYFATSLDGSEFEPGTQTVPHNPGWVVANPSSPPLSKQQHD